MKIIGKNPDEVNALPSGAAEVGERTQEPVFEAESGETGELPEQVSMILDNSEEIEEKTEVAEITENSVETAPQVQESSKESENESDLKESEDGAVSEDLFDPETDLVEEKRKYEKNRLDDEIAAAYAKEAADLMESKKLYKNPDLTLPMMAKKLGLTTNILSQVLNGYCGQSFYNFVNTYRISEAISMMNDPKYENESIIRILTEAGFKSKSSFNTLFKKQTGLTPSEFRQNLKKESENR